MRNLVQAMLVLWFCSSAFGAEPLSRQQTNNASETQTCKIEEKEISPSMCIIRKISLSHCARGPNLCKKCKDMAQEKICLLDVSPPNEGMIARPTIKVTINGKEVWKEYDIVRQFADEAEAKEYAKTHGITDLDF